MKKQIDPPNNNGLRYHIGPTHATPGEITDSEYFQGAMIEAVFAVPDAECYIHEDIDKLVKSKQLRATLRAAVSARIKTAMDLVILAMKECTPMVNTFNAHREARKRHGIAGKATPHKATTTPIIERVCRAAWTRNQQAKTPLTARSMAFQIVANDRRKAKPELPQRKPGSMERMITGHFAKYPNMPKT